LFEYILDNKEWIFSGIGVFILGLIFLFFKYFLKKDRSQEKNIEIISRNIPNSEISNLAPTSDIAQEEVFKIIQDFESLPPLQLDDIRRHYRGLNVDWMTEYSSVYKKDDDVIRVSLHLITKSFRPISVHCEVKLSEYKQFSILKRKAKIRVTGKVIEFRPYSIELSDVKLVFQK
jgi:hypothetical protein